MPNPAKTKPATKPAAVSFLKLKPILDILESCIWTGRLADEKPVSTILIAQQESAKTECLKYFSGTPTLKFFSDLTSRGLLPYKSDIERGKLRHIVIMDLVRLVNHGKGVSTRTIQTLASIIEEGEADSADAGGVASWQNFPQIGCLAAITPEFYEMKKGGWRSTGFLTRFLPIRFAYSDDTVHDIHNAILNNHKLPKPQPLKIFENAVLVRLEAPQAKAIANRAENLGKDNNVYGFRYHRAMRALAKAHALTEGRGLVNDADVLKVLEWSDFFSNKIIKL